MTIAAGQRVTAGALTINTYEAICTSDLALISTETDVTGASVTVTAQTGSATYLATASFRFDKTATASTAFGIGLLNVDGASDAERAIARCNLAAVDTRNCAQTWRGTLTAGSHTFKLRGSCATSSIWSIIATDTKLTVVVFG